MESQYPSSITLEEREQLGMYFTEEHLCEFMMRQGMQYLSGRDSIKMLEPAVGGGAFFRSMLLHELNQTEGALEDLEKILQRMTGIDIEEKVLQLSRENILHEMTKYFPKAEEKIKSWIENSLIEGDFLTEKILDHQTFDFVLGNPPYIGERGNKELFRKTKQTPFGQQFYQKGMDYFYYFIHRGVSLLSEGGILGFIIPSYWSRADSAQILRDFLRQNTQLLLVIDFEEKRLFKGAQGHHSSIIFIKKILPDQQNSLFKNYTYSHVTITGFKKDIPEALEGILSGVNESPHFHKKICNANQTLYKRPYFLFITPEEEQFLEYMETKGVLLGEIAKVSQGIVSGADKVNASNMNYLQPEDIAKYSILPGDGIFILSEEEAQPFIGKTDKIKLFYKNSSIRPYEIYPTNQYLLYVDRLLQEDETTVLEHLRKFKGILQRRREVVKGQIPYYALQWSRREEIFLQPKLVLPQRAIRPTFAWSNQEFYASADVYIVHKMKLNPFFLLGYLNSDLILTYLDFAGKKKGKYFELYARPVGEIPILILEEGVQNRIALLAEKATNVPNGDRAARQRYIDEINHILYEFVPIPEIQRRQRNES